MSRQIILDTETTGLEPAAGHRIIEIACIELAGRQVSDSRFHRFINPQRTIDSGAQAVHGITDERVANELVFAEIVDDLLKFIQDAELIIHNADFDVGFLDAEFALLGLPRTRKICTVTDTLRMAREMRPGKRNSLDALCRDYGIDNSGRQLHGALLDAELLAEVYLAMTRGQDSLMIALAAPDLQTAQPQMRGQDVRIKVIAASAEEMLQHEALLLQIDKESKGNCQWLCAAN